MMRRLNVSVDLDRIPADGNLSDAPSRAAWDPAGKFGWAIVKARFPACSRILSKGPCQDSPSTVQGGITWRTAIIGGELYDVKGLGPKCNPKK